MRRCRQWLAAILVAAVPSVAAAANDDSWRVLSHRIVWPRAALALQQRLCAHDLATTRLVRRESITMHVFDDARRYATRSLAIAAQRRWAQLGIPAEIERRGDGYALDLGRYYITEYALALEARLKAIGRPYDYRRMRKTVPVFRLVLPATDKARADRLWRRLRDLGLAAPVEIPETEFRRLYPEFRDQPAPCTSAAKRSNR